MKNIFISNEQIVTISELYNILGIKNLLTDDEMNIANTVQSDPAKQAITNIKYANGISSFHYRGVPSYEIVNWEFAVQPNCNYKMLIELTSSNQIPPLGMERPFMPWAIIDEPNTVLSDMPDSDSAKMPAPLRNTNCVEINFNSGIRTSLALAADFGYLIDGYDSDMSVELRLLRTDSLQDQINQLKSKLGGVKPSYRLYYATLKEVA